MEATANSGYRAYPAALTNVIAVAAADEWVVDSDMQMQKGIDITAPAEHELTVEKTTVRLEKSNSYAAPYVTARVGNLMRQCAIGNVQEAWGKLYESINYKGIWVCEPDWIEKAWFPEDFRITVLDIEKLHDFLYWQTYYKQSDAVLLLTDCTDNKLEKIHKIDLWLDIKQAQTVEVKIYAEANLRENKKLTGDEKTRYGKFIIWR